MQFSTKNGLSAILNKIKGVCSKINYTFNNKLLRGVILHIFFKSILLKN